MASWNLPRGPQLRYVAKVALAALVAWGLTLGSRNDYALFSAMAAAMVVGGSLGEDLSSSLNRVRGTLVGTAVGLTCAAALGASVWSLGLTVASIAWITVGFGWGPAAMRIGLAMALVILFTHGGDAAGYALHRALNTLGGVAIGLAVGRLVWPIRGRDRITGAIDRLLDAIAATLAALGQEGGAGRLMQQELEVLDRLSALRTARKDAKVEQRLHPEDDLLLRETLLAARAGVASLEAGLRCAELGPATSEAAPIPAVRAALAALAACVRGGPEPGPADADFADRRARAVQELAAAPLEPTTRASLGILLDELDQLHAALLALRKERSPRADHAAGAITSHRRDSPSGTR